MILVRGIAARAEHGGEVEAGRPLHRILERHREVAPVAGRRDRHRRRGVEAEAGDVDGVPGRVLGEVLRRAVPDHAPALVGSPEREARHPRRTGQAARGGDHDLRHPVGQRPRGLAAHRRGLVQRHAGQDRGDLDRSGDAAVALPGVREGGDFAVLHPQAAQFEPAGGVGKVGFAQGFGDRRACGDDRLGRDQRAGGRWRDGRLCGRGFCVGFGRRGRRGRHLLGRDQVALRGGARGLGRTPRRGGGVRRPGVGLRRAGLRGGGGGLGIVGLRHDRRDAHYHARRPAE